MPQTGYKKVTHLGEFFSRLGFLPTAILFSISRRKKQSQLRFFFWCPKELFFAAFFAAPFGIRTPIEDFVCRVFLPLGRGALS